jgi:hypothetical protein
VIGVPAQAEVCRPWQPTFWRVSDAIAWLRQLLDGLPDGSPLVAFLSKVDGTEPERVLRGRVAVSSTLVAGLELARAGVVALNQEAPWTPSGCSIGTISPRPSRVLSGLWLETGSGAVTASGRSINSRSVMVGRVACGAVWGRGGALAVRSAADKRDDQWRRTTADANRVFTRAVSGQHYCTMLR